MSATPVVAIRPLRLGADVGTAGRGGRLHVGRLLAALRGFHRTPPSPRSRAAASRHSVSGTRSSRRSGGSPTR